MPEHSTLLILSALPLCWALMASRLATTPITGPLFMMVLGIVLGPGGSGLLNIEIEADSLNVILTFTLVLVLFSDAARINVARLIGHHALPARLLLIGLPLTVVAGTMAALSTLAGIGVGAAVVLAVALAPTDAALGAAVIENERVPATIRQGLNVESGLNDGIAVPLFLIAVASAEGVGSTFSDALSTIGLLLGAAVFVGLGVGFGGAFLLRRSADAGWSDVSWRMVATPLLALIAYSGAEILGGSGFVAAFVAGATLAGVMADEVRELSEGGEEIGHLLTLLSFLIFGAAVLGPILGQVTVPIILCAVLSLTVVRMVPVALALIGMNYSRPTVAFVGWFGPRGLASIIFAAELVRDAEFEGAEMVARVIAVAVGLSVVAHGMSAAPLATRYADWVQRQTSLDREHDSTAGIPLRRRL